MNEPKVIYQGDNYEWTESLSDYPAGTYTLKYKFTGVGNLTVTATADGTNHKATISVTDSAKLNAGIYRLVGYVEKSGERKVVYDAYVDVKPNWVDMPAGSDVLSTARATLANIETAIKNYATNPYQTLTINGRTKTNWSLTELFHWRGVLKAEIQREEDALRIASGISSSRRIFVRFEETGNS